LFVKASEWARRMGHDRFQGKDAEAVAAWVGCLKADLEELVLFQRALDKLKKFDGDSALNDMIERGFRLDIQRFDRLHGTAAEQLQELRDARKTPPLKIQIVRQPSQKEPVPAAKKAIDVGAELFVVMHGPRGESENPAIIESHVATCMVLLGSPLIAEAA